MLGTEGWGQECTPGRGRNSGTCGPSQLDLVPGAGAAARKHGERASPAGVQSPLRLWEPPLSAALSHCMSRGCGFSPADLPALQLPVEADGLPTPGSQPQVLQALPPAAVAGLSLPLFWPSPGGPGVAPALCTAPPIQEQEPDPGLGLASHGLLPFPGMPCLLFCTAFPRSLRGCPFPAADATPAPSSHLPQPSARLFLLPALDLHPPEPTVGPSASRSAASRPSGTLTSVVVKVGSGLRALMLTRAARATPVQPEAESEAAFQGLRGTQPPWGVPTMRLQGPEPRESGWPTAVTDTGCIAGVHAAHCFRNYARSEQCSE